MIGRHALQHILPISSGDYVVLIFSSQAIPMFWLGKRWTSCPFTVAIEDVAIEGTISVGANPGTIAESQLRKLPPKTSFTKTVRNGKNLDIPIYIDLYLKVSISRYKSLYSEEKAYGSLRKPIFPWSRFACAPSSRSRTDP